MYPATSVTNTCKQSVMPSNFRLLFSFLLLHCLVKEVPSQSSVTNNDLAELSKAFEDNLAYFDREYKKLDSDAVLGLRVAEGTMDMHLLG